MHDHFTYDELEFQEDMEYMRSLAGALFEHARPLLASPPEASIFARLKADVSPEVRRAVFGFWGSLGPEWEAA